MVDTIDDVLAHAETIVIGNGAEEFRDVVDTISKDKVVIDLVRITDKRSIDNYDGICW